MNDIENKLTGISAYPILGTLAGCTKILIGAAQSITALACGILFLIPTAITKDCSLLKYCWTHIKHGLGNIAAGIVEAIPLVQSVAYVARVGNQIRTSDLQTPHLFTGHENKCMPYISLIEEDWFIGEGCIPDGDEIKKVNEMFERKLQENGGVENLSSKRQMELAQEAIEEC